MQTHYPYRPLVNTIWEQPPRPQRIGLALGGGAARGVAHVGVLEVLEEHRIPIHCIAGTSAGAMAGGLLAAGVSARRMHELVRNLSWMRISSIPSISLSALTSAGKNLTNLNLAAMGLPLGLLDLDKMIDWLEGIMGGSIRFDELNVPFAAVAADIARGEMVVLNEGPIAQAIRVSSSVPGVFTPVWRNGRLLVDGGAINNVPVSVVRQMGADYVIAVDLLPPPGDEYAEPRNVLEVTLMSLYSLIHASQGIGPQADRTIVPNIAHVSLIDMAAGSELIAAGRVAAEAMMPIIKDDLGLDES